MPLRILSSSTYTYKPTDPGSTGIKLGQPPSDSGSRALDALSLDLGNHRTQNLSTASAIGLIRRARPLRAQVSGDPSGLLEFGCKRKRKELMLGSPGRRVARILMKVDG